MAGKMPKVSYQRLRQEVIFEEDDKIKERRRSMEIIKRSIPRISWFGKLRRKKLRIIRFSGFRRFFKIRRSVKVAKKVSCARVLKRLKESQSHLGDLFAGNYLFMQVTPGSFNKNKTTANCVAHHNYYQNNAFSSFSHSLNYMC